MEASIKLNAWAAFALGKNPGSNLIWRKYYVLETRKFVRLKSSEKYFRIYWGQYFPFLWWGVCWGSLHHGGCDCSTQTLWFLQKLPPKLDCDAIEQDVEKLRRQQVVVSKKVLQLILQKHATFSEEFARLEPDFLSRTVITVLLLMYNIIHRRDDTFLLLQFNKYPLCLLSNIVFTQDI